MEQGTTKPTIHPLKLLALSYGLKPEFAKLLSTRGTGSGDHVKVRVRLFAAARQLCGAETLDVELPEPASIATLRAALAATCPPLAAHQRHLLFAVDAKYAGDDAPLTDGGEVACIPPVSGG